MKHLFRFVLITSLSVICATTVLSQSSPRSRDSFNYGWKFVRYFNSSEEPDNLQMPSVNDSNWRSVDLPHDWAIEGPFGDTLENNTGLLPWKGIGWYRKHFTANESDKGKRTYIDFDGAMAYSEVWLNGNYVGGWPYGYTSFRLDLTPYINYVGENIIAVRLNTTKWDSRWYPGAGIYRNVWLVKTSEVHIAHNGVFCTTPEVNKGRAIISVLAEVENHLTEPAEISVESSVYKVDKNGNQSDAVFASSLGAAAEILPGKSHEFREDIVITQPLLWDINDPQLYRIVVTVRKNEKATDSYGVNIGLRTTEFTAREGFYLNGRRVEIKGVCMHHDLGALGAAFNVRAAERQLKILREMGCNAIRTSHNPPAPELLDLCDRMGFLVEDEVFDAWRIGKKPLDYNLLFNAWHAEDLKALVRRDRDHPSVIIWSIGNEIREQNMPWMAENLKNIVKSEDPTRPVTAGCDQDEAGTNGFQKALDIFGINYRLHRYDAFFKHEENANLPFHASESASTVTSRGEYFFPVVQGDLDKNLPGKGIFQISSYDLSYPWWASTPDQQWEMIDKYPGTFGEFVWTGFDYLGEPTPYYGDLTGLKPGTPAYDEMKKKLDAQGITEVPSRSSYFGILDLAGFKKDRFWLYQSKWRPDLPMAHILPHWNWPERKGLVTPVHVYTSGDEAELFLNGKSLGRKKKGESEYRLRWNDVVYQPGELKVIAYKNGEKWAEDVMKTTGKAYQVSMSPDRREVAADGKDLTFITVRIEDKNGLTVPRSNDQVSFTVEGPGRIVATDNGDATSHESFQSPSRKAYNGMCLVIVAAEKGSSGSIILKAESKGLKSTSTKITIENK